MSGDEEVFEAPGAQAEVVHPQMIGYAHAHLMPVFSGGWKGIHFESFQSFDSFSINFTC